MDAKLILFFKAESKGIIVSLTTDLEFKWCSCSVISRDFMFWFFFKVCLAESGSRRLLPTLHNLLAARFEPGLDQAPEGMILCSDFKDQFLLRAWFYESISKINFLFSKFLLLLFLEFRFFNKQQIKFYLKE